MTNKEHLVFFVEDFKKWRRKNYSEQQIEINAVDDPSYPRWEEIRSFFEQLLHTKAISLLDDTDYVNLLYLIARSYDDSPFLSELSEGRPISHYGDLTDQNFIRLGRIASNTYGAEYDDGKASVAICFRKLEYSTPDIEEILLRLYADENEYTKRQALLSLAKLGYRNIGSLIENSWAIKNEWHKIGCLMALDEYVNDKNLLLKYITDAKNSTMKDLANYSQKLYVKNCN